MRTLAYQRNKYSAELYKYVRESVGDTSELKYYFVGNVMITAGIDKTGRMNIRADQPFAVGTLLKDIKDSDGNLILDDTIWQVSNLEPILNAFNAVESYRMRATKFQGTI
jgi:hypothetical protein